MKKSLELFWIFFKIGLFTFGGGYAMIPQIKEVVIEKKKWISEEEMLDIIAIAESTPGPIAINSATYIGYKQNKILGSIFATLGVVLPSFLIIFPILALFFYLFVAFLLKYFHFRNLKRFYFRNHNFPLLCYLHKIFIFSIFLLLPIYNG